MVCPSLMSKGRKRLGKVKETVVWLSVKYDKKTGGVGRACAPLPGGSRQHASL